MAICKSGKGSGLLLLIATGLFVYSAAPGTIWSIGPDGEEIGLWQSCNVTETNTTGVPTNTTECYSLNPEDFANWDNYKAMGRDAAVAGVVLAAVFDLIGLITACWPSRAGPTLRRPSPATLRSIGTISTLATGST